MTAAANDDSIQTVINPYQLVQLACVYTAIEREVERLDVDATRELHQVREVLGFILSELMPKHRGAA